MTKIVVLVGLFCAGAILPTTAWAADPVVDTPAEERLPWHPPELVNVYGSHRGRHWGTATAFAVSPDGKNIATGGNRWLRIWDAKTLREKTSLQGLPGSVNAISFSADGRDLAGSLNLYSYSGNVAEVHVWEMRDGQLKIKHQLTGFDAHTRKLSYSTDGKTLSFHVRRNVHFFDSLGDRLHERAVLVIRSTEPVAIAPDGKRVAVLGNSGNNELWDVGAGGPKRLQTWKSNQRIYGSRATISPDGQTMLLPRPQRFQVWDIAAEPPRLVRQISPLAYGKTRGSISAGAFVDDQHFVIFGTGKSLLWRLDGLDVKLIAEFALGLDLSGGVALPGGRGLVTVGTRRNDQLGTSELRLWSIKGDTIAENQISKQLHSGFRFQYSRVQDQLRFLPDGKSVVVSTAAGPVQLNLADRSRRAVSQPGFAWWSLAANGKTIGTLRLKRSMVRPTFTPTTPGEIWNLADASRAFSIGQPQDKKKQFKSIVVSANGLLIAAFDGAAVRVWDVKQQKEIGTIPAKSENHRSRFLDNESLLISNYLWSEFGEPVVEFHLWRAVEGKLSLVTRFEVPRHDSHGGVWALSSNGHWLASQRAGEGVFVYEVAGAQPKLHSTIPFPDRQYFLQAISPDGGTIAMATYGHLHLSALSVVDVGTRRMIREWPVPGAVRTAEFSPDSKQLLTANPDGTIFVLNVPSRAHLKPLPVMKFSSAPPKPNPSGMAAFRELKAAFQKENKQFRQRLNRAKTKQKKNAIKKQNPHAAFQRRMSELAEQHRETMVELEALIWLAGQGEGAVMQQARERLLQRYIREPQIARVVSDLILQPRHRRATDVARRLYRENPHQRVKAYSLWWLTHVLEHYTPNYYVRSKLTPRQIQVIHGLFRRIEKDYGEVLFHGNRMKDLVKPGLKKYGAMKQPKSPSQKNQGK